MANPRSWIVKGTNDPHPVKKQVLVEVETNCRVCGTEITVEVYEKFADRAAGRHMCGECHKSTPYICDERWTH